MLKKRAFTYILETLNPESANRQINKGGVQRDNFGAQPKSAARPSLNETLRLDFSRLTIEAVDMRAVAGFGLKIQGLEKRVQGKLLSKLVL